MALGLSLSLNMIPGVSGLLAKLDGLKASFLAVPANVNAALDKLALVRQAMAQNGAPPSAQSDALTVEQHLNQIKSEWSVAAASEQQIANARNHGGLSLDNITAAGTLVTSMAYVLSNMNSLQASVDNLAAKYLTPAQRQAVNQKYSSGMFNTGGGSLLPLLLIGGAALYLSRRRG